MENIKPWYISGLIEGEGSFSISFSFRKKLKIGIETRPSFSVTLNQRDLALLKKVQSYFNCGGIRFSKSDRTYKFEVRSIQDIVKYILPHFNDYPLIGAKHLDFQKFKKICLLIYESKHLNKHFLIEIIEDAYSMNPSGKRKHDKKALLRTLTR